MKPHHALSFIPSGGAARPPTIRACLPGGKRTSGLITEIQLRVTTDPGVASCPGEQAWERVRCRMWRGIATDGPSGRAGTRRQPAGGKDLVQAAREYDCSSRCAVYPARAVLCLAYVLRRRRLRRGAVRPGRGWPRSAWCACHGPRGAKAGFVRRRVFAGGEGMLPSTPTPAAPSTAPPMPPLAAAQ
jgi:hypothetical protein